MRTQQLAVVCTLMLTACHENTTGPPGNTAIPSLISESVVLDTSEPVPATALGGGEFAFELGASPLFVQDTMNEIELVYETPSSCDRKVFLYDVESRSWEPIGFSITLPVICFSVVTDHRQTLRDLYPDVSRYLDESGTLRVRSHEARPLSARAVRVRETYFARRPIGPGNINSFDGLASEEGRIWASSNFTDRIYELDRDGRVIVVFLAPGGFPFGLAFGDGSLWVADGSDRIYRLTPDGQRRGAFTVPTDFPGGLAFGAGSLWLSEYQGPDLRTFRIAAEASCQSGSAVVQDAFLTPGGGSRGLAWTGSELLVASDRLYVVAPDGEIRVSFELPVVGVRGLAWDGETVLMLSHGPPGVGNDGVKLNRFRLP